MRHFYQLIFLLLYIKRKINRNTKYQVKFWSRQKSCSNSCAYSCAHDTPRCYTASANIIYYKYVKLYSSKFDEISLSLGSFYLSRAIYLFKVSVHWWLLDSILKQNNFYETIIHFNPVNYSFDCMTIIIFNNTIKL